MIDEKRGKICKQELNFLLTKEYFQKHLYTNIFPSSLNKRVWFYFKCLSTLRVVFNFYIIFLLTWMCLILLELHFLFPCFLLDLDIETQYIICVMWLNLFLLLLARAIANKMQHQIQIINYHYHCLVSEVFLLYLGVWF